MCVETHSINRSSNFWRGAAEMSLMQGSGVFGREARRLDDWSRCTASSTLRAVSLQKRECPQFRTLHCGGQAYGHWSLQCRGGLGLGVPNSDGRNTELLGSRMAPEFHRIAESLREETVD